jgi:hypothetical protein
MVIRAWNPSGNRKEGDLSEREMAMEMLAAYRPGASHATIDTVIPNKWTQNSHDDHDAAMLDAVSGRMLASGGATK